MDDFDQGEIETIIGYHFFEEQHLFRALTHTAYANEMLRQNRKVMDQEAYSTLGDAVLKTALILFLMEKGYQTKGEITRKKESLESNVSLARIGKRLKIKKFIRLGKGAKGLWKSGEETILADTIEAIIGAIFLDSDAGFGVVKQCIGSWVEPELEHEKNQGGTLREIEEPVPGPAKRQRVKSGARSGRIGSQAARDVSLPLSSSRRGAPRGMKKGSQR